MIVGACLFVILTLFILFIEYQSYQFQLSQLAHQQSRITEGQVILLADQLSENTNDNHDDAAFLTLSGIIANPAIVGVELSYSDESEPLVIGDVSGAITYADSVAYMNDDYNMIDVGKLTTFATTNHIDVALRKRITYLAGLVATLLVSILFITTVVLRKYVGKPLALIVNTIEQSDIEEAAQIDWQSDDEIGQVIHRLNALHQNQKERVVVLKQEINDSEIRESERLRSLANASFEAILIYKDNVVLDINDRMEAMLNSSKEKLVSQSMDISFDGEFLDALMTEKELGGNYFERINLPVDSNQSIPVELYVSDFKYGSVDAKVAVLRDISDRVEAERHIRFLAHHDELTRLLNRRAFMDSYEKALETAVSEGSFLAVMYLDLDKFKEVNDIFGHAAGDKLLKSVSDGLIECAGNDSLIARLGGDEFAILISGKDQLSVNPEKIASEFLDVINKCKESCSVGGGFGASIGIAVFDGSCSDNNDLLIQADLALYHAKDTGRNNYKLYDHNLGIEQSTYRLMIDRLLMAIQESKLEMHYQPQLEVSSGEIIGFEALLRWNDEVLGQVPPPFIIEAAQKERITDKLSEWILNAVLAQAATWPPEYAVSINLTPADLANKNLSSYIHSLLNKYNISPRRLNLEITESAVIADVAHAARIVKDLQSLGISVALDDFGTGYSSLSFLHQLSFDRIKLDKSFISTSQIDSLKIAKAIIELGSELGVEVLAEGVETAEQMNRMRVQRCHSVQGYFISKPLSTVDLHDYIDSLQNPKKKAS